jgi:hypothetical protein
MTKPRPAGWPATLVRETELDPKSPLIYQFEVHDPERGVVARYIGKAKVGDKRPRNTYPNNVRRLLAGQPWHGDASADYRTQPITTLRFGHAPPSRW